VELMYKCFLGRITEWSRLRVYPERVSTYRIMSTCSSLCFSEGYPPAEKDCRFDEAMFQDESDVSKRPSQEYMYKVHCGS
jgi:hypothetical protein